MTRLRAPLGLLPVALVLAACQPLALQPGPRPVPTIEEAEEWRNVASADDAAALDRLPEAWTQVQAELRSSRLARRAEAEGSLLDPRVALPRAAPAPGPYMCRLIRLGAAALRARPWLEAGGFYCFVGVDGGRLSLTVEGGPERLGGYLWEEKDGARAVFLGSAARGRDRLGAYGDSRATDAIGLIERLGDFRYRLTLPGRGDNRLSVYELVAAPR
jgi:hypothetical protein